MAALEHDALTGLPNRSVILDRLDDGLARSAAIGTRVGLLFCDLDGFKAINDAHGHAVGDQVLVEIARRLSAAIRPQDTVARIGGDEFLVVARDLEEPDAGPMLVARLGAAVTQPFRLRSLDLSIGASIGLAVTTGGDRNAAALIELADVDMYREKRARASRRTIVLPAEDEQARSIRP